MQSNNLIKETFEEKKLEFENMDLEKFSQGTKMKFKDGTYTYNWFRNNRRRMEKESDEVSLQILNQYNNYFIVKNKKTKQETYLRRVREFEKMNNEKFCIPCSLRFSDGALVSSWFNNYKWKLQIGNDELSKSIMNQFDEWKISKYGVILSFEDKLNEFEKASIEKFDTSSRLKFSDGYFMAAWFRNNRKKIENRNDELSLSIMKQYYDCKPLRRLIKLNFEDKLNEFERASLDKFDESKEMKFSDDTYMIIWFRNNKSKIEDRCDDLSKSILKQYLLARKQRKNYNAKLMEFYSADLSKFNIALSKKFSDGTVMSFWYYNNRNIIKNSNDDISKEIVRQHEEYINGNKIYIDDSLDKKRINK